MSEQKKSLVDLFKPIDGYEFVRGVGCTYSANQETIKEMQKALGIDYSIEKMEKFEKGETFKLFFSQGKYEGDVKNYLVPVTVEEGCLHAKAYLMVYSKGASSYVRVIIASANLTNSDELNVYACEESYDKTIDLSEIESVEKLLGKIKDLLGDKFLYGTWGEQKLKIESGAKVIVSPFLTEGTVKAIFNGFDNKHLVSRKDEIDNLSDTIKKSDIKFYVLDDENDENSGSLHSKMYIYDDHFYLGSANCTYSAFSKNIECLVKIDESIVVEEFLKMYVPYTPSKVEEGALVERKKFDTICRNIVSTFEFDEDKYSVIAEKVPSNDYVVTVDGKSSENFTWTRENQKKHIVKLGIRFEGFYSEFPMFVDGEDLEVNKDKIKMEIMESVKGFITEMLTLNRDDLIMHLEKARKIDDKELQKTVDTFLQHIKEVKSNG